MTLPMELANNDLALLNRELRAIDKKITIDRVPPAVMELLLMFHPDSSHKDYRDKTLRYVSQYAQTYTMQHYGAELNMREVSPKFAYNFVRDVCKGMLYASRILAEEDPDHALTQQSPFHFKGVGTEGRLSFEGKLVSNFEAAVGVTDNAVDFGIAPMTIYQHASDQFAKHMVRDYTVLGLPGNFSQQEKTILLGVEEACHAYQALKLLKQGKDVAAAVGYDTNTGVDLKAHQNSPVEKQAIRLMKRAVKDLGLGERGRSGGR